MALSPTSARQAVVRLHGCTGLSIATGGSVSVIRKLTFYSHPHVKIVRNRSKVRERLYDWPQGQDYSYASFHAPSLAGPGA